MLLVHLLTFPLAASCFVAPIPPRNAPSRSNGGGSSSRPLFSATGLPNEIVEQEEVVDFAELYNLNEYEHMLEATQPAIANVKNAAQSLRKTQLDQEEAFAKMDERLNEVRQTEQALLKEKDYWKLAFYCLNHYAKTGRLELRLSQERKDGYEKVDFSKSKWDGALFDSCLATLGLQVAKYRNHRYFVDFELSLVDEKHDEEDATEESSSKACNP